MNDLALIARALALALAIPAAACSVISRSHQTTWTEESTGMVFVEIPAGQFVMGSPADEPERESQEVQHEVTITRPFWMGKFEVTQQQWQSVMGDNPSWFGQNGDDRPVERVSWYDVNEFLNRLTARVSGNRFRLPTEAEWEYACRAGATTPYNTRRELTRADANVGDPSTRAVNRKGQTLPAGSFPANSWGLHDMHGNVWEWTSDEYCPYVTSAIMDPLGRCGSSLKVIRGGSWYFEAGSARCALRYTHRPVDAGFSLGFRVVREQSH